MKYLSLFSGIGGFELGIQQAYEEICNNEHAHISEEPEQEERSQGRERSTNKSEVQLHTGNRTAPLCIGYSEIDKYAIQVYNKHFNHKNYGDICSIKWEEVPDIDLVVGGFPCQSFSIAGKRKGFEDTRGTLFFEIAKGLKIKQPDFVLLENVKGLVSHDKGKTLEVILETLQELGYYVNIEVYNSKDFSVPQNRERIFILCRHIKTLINDGIEQSLNLSSPTINEFLFQILLNNLVEVKKLQETKSKDWVIGYLLLKEIYQSLESKEKSTKDGILILMEESKSLSTEELWQNIDTWLVKNLTESSNELNKSTTLTAIRQIIESKTYTYSKMLQSILALIVQSKNSSKGLWKKTLLNLTLIREHTKKYARFNDKKEEVVITETGNAYLVSNLQDFEKHFIIGHLRGTSRPEVFPLGGGTEKDIIQLNSPTHSNNRLYGEEGISPTLNTAQGGNRQPKIVTPTNRRTECEISGTITSHYRGSPDGDGRPGLLYDGKIRRLTPKECERLQGFPDDWTKEGNLSGCDKSCYGKHLRCPGHEVQISDTQRYKMAGNAVSVPVIKALVNRF